ncbi:hypothetical protein JXD38_05760 [candidate division WOR-3 bacterium]|nr:hypothetical protein [candidate division WOR-3 bacterium]
MSASQKAPGPVQGELRATFICSPCNSKAGTGRTEWTFFPVNPDAELVAVCPACGAKRKAALLTDLASNKSSKPGDQGAATARGKGAIPEKKNDSTDS